MATFLSSRVKNLKVGILGYTDSTEVAEFIGNVGVTGTVVADGLSLGDAEQITLGASNDLKIFEDSSDGHLQVTNGNIFLRTNREVRIMNDTTTKYIARFDQLSNGRVLLYYDNRLKFETTNTGITVTGTVVADGISADGGEIHGQFTINGAVSTTIVANPNTISSDSIIPDDHNANSWGPITIAPGTVVTIGNNSIWNIR